jgi:hypothetical protein
MIESEFAALTSRRQVNKLRAVALKALRAYPLEVKRLSLLSHGFNTIFRVDDARGQKFALRLNVMARRERIRTRGVDGGSRIALGERCRFHAESRFSGDHSKFFGEDRKPNAELSRKRRVRLILERSRFADRVR